MKYFAILAMLASPLNAAAVATGPAVGARALPFETVDQNGQSHTLKSLLGPKGAIIVFYRSADW